MAFQVTYTERGENTDMIPLGPALILLLLMLAAVYCGYRAFAPRPRRWAVGTVLVLWLLLFTAACLVVASRIH